MPIESIGYAARDTTGVMTPWKYTWRDLDSKDVQIKVKYCGMCHTDIHMARGEWGSALSLYPMVPGHEVVGEVVAVGKDVTKLKVGDRAAVGFLVGSCKNCKQCNSDNEMYCEGMGFVSTFSAKNVYKDNAITQGGYGNNMVVDESFVCKFPDTLDMCNGAPLMCAGITLWSPMIHFGMNKPGKRIGVVGLGGLGHMAVIFAVAFGSEAVVISRNRNKEEEARKVLGASDYIASSEPEAMAAAYESLDFIVDTVSAPKDMDSYLKLLKPDGTLVTVGLPPEGTYINISPANLIFRRKRIAGSLVGSMKETQDMLDFCGKHNITCMCEKIPMSYANEAWERIARADVRYRFVLDVSTMPTDAPTA